MMRLTLIVPEFHGLKNITLELNPGINHILCMKLKNFCIIIFRDIKEFQMRIFTDK